MYPQKVTVLFCPVPVVVLGVTNTTALLPIPEGKDVLSVVPLPKDAVVPVAITCRLP
jgi:hypothetical protein